MLDDFRSTHRVVDEARMKEDETNRMIRMRELDMEERENEKSRKMTNLAYGIALAFLLLGGLIGLGGVEEGYFGVLIAMIIAEFTFIKGMDGKEKRKEAKYRRAGMIKLSSEQVDVKKHDYRSVEDTYRRLGFTQISIINKRDLITGLLKKHGQVCEITIGGETPEAGKWYYASDSVVIMYHGFHE